jgi:predicted nucleic-acid-binding protein
VDAVDTNVLVRLLVADDASQTRRARTALSAPAVFISKTVLLECEWVLRYSYALKAPAITSALRAVLGLPNVAAEDEEQIDRALTWHEQGMDFADALHLAASGRARRFVTFDKAFARQAKALKAGDVTAL